MGSHEVEPVKVRVADRWRVTHDGKAYVLGDELTVPADVADQWVRSRWVERVTSVTKET